MNAQVVEAHGCSVFLTKLYLTIENLMDRPVKVHCKSKNNDMGEHTLRHGMRTTFSFRANPFGRTYFWCNVFWKGRWVAFAAYDDDRDSNRCYKNHCDCHWAVTSKGPCFWNRNTRRHDLCESWRY
uniref:S-protein homolog n=1 Tax=Kalanchoe fedtschenkoi TaxID=63787 RepID=A0A7N0V9A2_KALFE